MNFSPILFSAAETSRTFFELSRLAEMTSWWHWMVPAAIVALIVFYVVRFYWHDSVELPRGTAWTVGALRLLALAALLFYFFGPDLRTERKIVKDSRFVLLVDTSQSMARRDADAAGGKISRIQQVIDCFAGSRVLSDLQRKHDVAVYQFDQHDTPSLVASLEKKPAEPTGGEETAQTSPDAAATILRGARWFYTIVGSLAAVGLALLAWHLVRRFRPASPLAPYQGWPLFASMLLLVSAVVLAAVTNLRYPRVGPMELLGRAEIQPVRSPEIRPTDESSPLREEATEADPRRIAWNEKLTPRGTETRLGEALRYVIEKERGGSIAGVAVLSDGCNNAGIRAEEAFRIASQAGIPVFPIGLGSDQMPLNVLVLDVEAPPRVYPKDSFTITGLIRAEGFEGRNVRVELLSRPATAPQEDGATPAQVEPTFEDEQRVQLGADGRIVTVKFELTPEEQGRRRYIIRVTPPEDDADAKDNEKSVAVDVVDRKNRVLILAGGPTREFQFLRNLLFRDKETTVDVLLQTAQPGISQEADDILFEFPIDREELFEYDCIVAIDPDWSKLDELQVDALQRWVAEKAGGLILIAGPVFMPDWTERARGDRAIDTIKALYPVSFFSRGSASLRRSGTAARKAWPLEFSDEGTRSQFLWLEDDAAANEAAWEAFPGVYSYFPVDGTKPGAAVYARFSDPESKIGSDLPPYIVGQFYGAGRIVFLGGGEMWRLNAVSDKYFEQFYTKLVRYVSQGRLLRDSTQGVLTVDKTQCLLGDPVLIRATLTDARHEPLKAEQVEAVLVSPDGTRRDIVLYREKGSAAEGVFTGQFTAVLEGDYRVELPVPESPAGELLMQEVRVRGSNLENQRVVRNDALLGEMAEKTAGHLFVGVPAALGQGGTPLAGMVGSNDQTTYLPGTPDRDFQQRLAAWTIALICGLLSSEWLIRRLNKLA